MGSSDSCSLKFDIAHSNCIVTDTDSSGGGGAGYYGGGGGGVSSVFATAPGGGGGGSSFIANGVTYSNLPSSVTSKLTSTNPSSTGGAIKIQWIGKTLPS